MLLGSGTRITEIQRRQDFIQVRTENNVIGWIKREHLRQFPPAALQLERLVPQMTQLELRLAARSAELAAAQKALAAAQEDAVSRRKALAGRQSLNAISQETGAVLQQDLQPLIEHHQTIMQTLAELPRHQGTSENTTRNSQTMSTPKIHWERLLEDFLQRPIRAWRAWQWLFGATLLLLLVWLGAGLSRWLRPVPEPDPVPEPKPEVNHDLPRTSAVGAADNAAQTLEQEAPPERFQRF